MNATSIYHLKATKVCGWLSLFTDFTDSFSHQQCIQNTDRQTQNLLQLLVLSSPLLETFTIEQLHKGEMTHPS